MSTITVPNPAELFALANVQIATEAERARNVLDILISASRPIRANRLVDAMGSYGIEQATARDAILEFVRTGRGRLEGGDVIPS